MQRLKKTNTTTTIFRQWSNRKYAVFNSIKKLICIGVLSVSYTIIMAQTNAGKKEDSIHISRVYQLDEVLIEPGQAMILPAQSQLIAIVTSDELKSLPAATLQDILNYSLIDIRERSPYGQADISIRGGTFDQVIVLLNGINFTDPQTGHYNLNLPVDAEVINRIEILKPSGAGLHSAGAFTGIINIITTEAKNDSILQINTAAGDYGLYKAGGRLGISRKNFSGIVSGSKSGHNGFRHNTAVENSQAFFSSSYSTGNSLIQMQLGYLKKQLGANSFYSARYPDQYDDNNSAIFSLQGTTGHTLKIRPAIYLRRHHDHYILIRNNPGAYQNYHRSDVAGGSLMAVYSYERYSAAGGVEQKYEGIISNNLGDQTETPIPVKGTDSLYHRSYNRNTTTFHLNQELKYRYIHLDLCMNMVNFSQENKYRYYPVFDITFPLNTVFNLSVGWRKAYRQPTFTDLFYIGRINTGNPSLTQEQSTTSELSIFGKIKNAGYHSSVYHRKGENIIDWYWNNNINKWMATNIANIRSHGVEAQIKYFAQQKSSTVALNQISIQYAYLMQKIDVNYQSLYVLDYLTHKITTAFEARIIKHAGASAAIIYADRNGTYLKYNQTTKTQDEQSYPKIITVNTRIFYVCNHITLYLEAQNLTDINYFDIGNLPQPGRWVSGGIIYKRGKNP